jgi:type III secretion system YscJ/HrcJ family lipoprotein
MRAMVRAKHLLIFLLLGTIIGCGVETVVNGLSEREANRIIELFDDNQIASTKGVTDTGREIFYNISVPPKSRIDAIKLLNLHELPRRKDRGYSEVFSETGLIPTSAEEKAKKMAALEGEIERQLKLIDGILDTQVQIVIPAESALRTAEDQISPTTASVTLRYLPGAGGAKPITEQMVQTLVSAGVENLTADRVFPLLTPVRSIGELTVPETPAPAGGSWLTRVPAKTVNVLTIVILAIILGLSLLLLSGHLRLRSAQTRLLRLQNEIAKAQRRAQSEEGLPPGAG